MGQTAQPAGVVTALAGTVTVARAAVPQPLPLKFRDEVFLRDRISTAEGSLVRVLLGGKALATIRELSVLTITEESGRSTVNVQSGAVAVSVARQRLQPGESVEIRTPNAVAAVRGTTVVVEVAAAAAAAAITTNVYVLQGMVGVSLLGGAPAAAVRVDTQRALAVTGGALGRVRELPPALRAQLAAELSRARAAQDVDSASAAKRDLALKEIDRAGQLAGDLGAEGDDQAAGGPRMPRSGLWEFADGRLSRIKVWLLHDLIARPARDPVNQRLRNE